MIYRCGDQKNPTVSSRENGPQSCWNSLQVERRKVTGGVFYRPTVLCKHPLKRQCFVSSWPSNPRGVYGGVCGSDGGQTRYASCGFRRLAKTASEGPAGRWVEPVTTPRERHLHLGVPLEDEPQGGFLCVQRGISLLSRNANSNTTASLTPLDMLVWYNNMLASFALWTHLTYSFC